MLIDSESVFQDMSAEQIEAVTEAVFQSCG